ncbi:hypothetical protein HAP48_0027780 [Bradyrhizobium septentrionale]|uniref:Calcium-binding protein n=1 Tax=Bradyrhizobium septentrionale TaxID=1404411 RepID=A0A974A0H3_9BRAD|nr:calcium-binding protein [Bradyrhizobium septentrionale]UGY12425.1 hypothetical protein HAP48_0027780 [Bradyrhizobium septentrionale]UGY21064.1 hypothetical protein HU675_0023700 [Bradyrhizobium septentrionale]
MTNYNFYKIDIPGGYGSNGFVYISIDGVDASGLAVGNVGDMDGDWHGITAAHNGSVTLYDPPASSNQTDVVGVTSSGELYGDFTDWSNIQHGFIESGGVTTTIDFPFAATTVISGITATGELFGSYVGTFTGVHGFLDDNGSFETIDDPLATSTSVFGVNASGVIVGTITDASGTHAFFNNNGTFTALYPPGSYSSSAVGVTASGEVVGTYETSSNAQYGFVYNNGAYTTIAGPGSTYTSISYVGDNGEIAGYYAEASGHLDGFLDQGGVFTTVDVPGATDTEILGVNAAGEIYGDYNDSTGQHGFVGIPGPQVVASNVTATHGETFAMSSLLSASDPTGAGIAEYVVYDTGSGGAQILVNGIAQPSQTDLYLTPAQLAQTTYRSGSGADVIWVEASNGSEWSPWAIFQVSAPVDTGPVVTVSNLAWTSGETFAATSLFSYSDPFGSPATEYEVWNAATNDGEFELNGTPLPANQDNIVTPAQLSQLSYVTDSASDIVWVRANDGTVWGPWTQAGGNANDVFYAGSASDLIEAGNGNDTFYGGSGNSTMYGGTGNDVYVGGSGESLEVGRGTATSLDYFYLSSAAGSEAFGGPAGEDVFVAGPNGSVMIGEGATNFMYGAAGGNNYFYGGSGDSEFFGGSGVDVMIGDSGRDYFDGGTGVNYYFGGAGGGPGSGIGVDTFNISQGGIDVVQDWTEGKDTVQLNGSGFHSFSDVLSHSYQNGAYFVVQVDADTAVWLNGATAATVTASDFRIGS